jgi:hypothetical protein
VQVFLVRPIHVAEVLPTGHGILMGLHALTREPPHAVGDHDKWSFEAQLSAAARRLDPGNVAGGGSQKVRSPHLRAELCAGRDSTLQQLAIGLFAPDHVSSRTM